MHVFFKRQSIQGLDIYIIFQTVDVSLDGLRRNSYCKLLPAHITSYVLSVPCPRHIYYFCYLFGFIYLL